MTDYINNKPLLGPAKMHSTIRAPTHSNFTFPRLEGLEWAGAFHGADIGFVFGAPFANISSLMEFFIPKYSEIEKGLSLYIMRLWTDFAKFG